MLLLTGDYVHLNKASKKGQGECLSICAMAPQRTTEVLHKGCHFFKNNKLSNILYKTYILNINILIDLFTSDYAS